MLKVVGYVVSFYTASCFDVSPTAAGGNLQASEYRNLLISNSG